MSLESISAQIKKQGNKIPPVELWDPEYCGEMDLQIKANGDWYYAGSIFKRPALVKLLASVLKKEADDYFLVTPVEKIKITVEDAPFMLTQWYWRNEQKNIMMVKTNIGDEFELNSEHAVEIADDGSLYVTVRRNLPAKVHRNVFYQWIDIAKEVKHANHTEMVIESAGYQVSLGRI